MGYSKSDARADQRAAQSEARCEAMRDQGVLPDRDAIRKAVIREICEEYDDYSEFDSFEEMAHHAAEKAANRLEEQTGSHRDLKDSDVESEADAVYEETLEDAKVAFIKSPNLKENRTDGVISTHPE